MKVNDMILVNLTNPYNLSALQSINLLKLIGLPALFDQLIYYINFQGGTHG